MPIGHFSNFGALKRHLSSGGGMKGITDPDAYTASVARKMEPEFDKNAGKKRRKDALDFHNKHYKKMRHKKEEKSEPPHHNEEQELV